MYSNPLESALFSSAEVYNKERTLNAAKVLVSADNKYIVSMYGNVWGNLTAEVKTYTEEDYIKRAEDIIKDLTDNGYLF